MEQQQGDGALIEHAGAPRLATGMERVRVREMATAMGCLHVGARVGAGEQWEPVHIQGASLVPRRVWRRAQGLHGTHSLQLRRRGSWRGAHASGCVWPRAQQLQG